MGPDLKIRRAESDADLDAWSYVRRQVLPNESAATVEQLRGIEDPDRLLVLAEVAGALVGSGLADRSQTTGGFVAPRILAEHRRRGAGSAVLRVLLDHLVLRGFRSASAHAQDDAALAFAGHHGFVEIDQQVEQVRTVSPNEPSPSPYPLLDFSSVAERPDLLERAYGLAPQAYEDLVVATGPVHVPLEEWLREEASLPAGSIVALSGGLIVGYAGLLAWNGDNARAEHGLTVVERAWRGRGLAVAMKQRQLAWASANGIRELVTWTQRGNEAMQRVNTRLGYVTRSVSRTMRRDLP